MSLNGLISSIFLASVILFGLDIVLAQGNEVTSPSQLPLTVSPTMLEEAGIVMPAPDSPDFYEVAAAAIQEHISELGSRQDIRAITHEMLEAVSIIDPQERYEALAAAISSLPSDLQHRFSAGFHVVDLRSAREPEYNNLPPRIPVDRALSLLPSDMQDALVGYEDVLYSEDGSRLLRSLRHMPDESRLAALKFHELRFQDPEEEAILAEIAAQNASLANAAIERGHYLREDEMPLPEDLLTKIRQHRLIASTNSTDSPLPQSQLNDLMQISLFQSAAEYERTTGEIAPRLPPYAVPADADAFVGPWSGDGSASIYTESMFGAPIAVIQLPVSEVTFDLPNLTIFNREASVVLIKYRHDEWATRVSAFDGTHLFHIEVSARLEGVQQDEFIRFATDVLEYYR